MILLGRILPYRGLQILYNQRSLSVGMLRCYGYLDHSCPDYVTIAYRLQLCGHFVTMQSSVFLRLVAAHVSRYA